MPTAFVVTPATAPAPLNVVGEQITVLASGSQTGGYEIFRQAGPEGSGPPPHFHPWDESFYVVKGDIAFGVGDKDMIAEPGTLVHLPAGTMHWFRFGKGGGEMMARPGPIRSASRSMLPRITVSRLLKSCATPPASRCSGWAPVFLPLRRLGDDNRDTP